MAPGIQQSNGWADKHKKWEYVLLTGGGGARKKHVRNLKDIKV